MIFVADAPSAVAARKSPCQRAIVYNALDVRLSASTRALGARALDINMGTRGAHVPAHISHSSSLKGPRTNSLHHALSENHRLVDGPVYAQRSSPECYTVVNLPERKHPTVKSYTSSGRCWQRCLLMSVIAATSARWDACPFDRGTAANGVAAQKPHRPRPYEFAIRDFAPPPEMTDGEATNLGPRFMPAETLTQTLALRAIMKAEADDDCAKAEFLRKFWKVNDDNLFLIRPTSVGDSGIHVSKCWSKPPVPQAIAKSTACAISFAW